MPGIHSSSARVVPPRSLNLISTACACAVVVLQNVCLLPVLLGIATDMLLVLALLSLPTILLVLALLSLPAILAMMLVLLPMHMVDLLTSSTVLRPMKRLCVQRMAMVPRSSWTKQDVRGKSSLICTWAKLPMASGSKGDAPIVEGGGQPFDIRNL